MSTALFPWHNPLRDASRLPLPRIGTESVSVSQMGVLFLCGAGAAAAVSWLDFSLKIPGHAILRAAFPMALGLAIVPRKGAGTLMSGGAMATAAILRFGGWAENGLGSLTSLCLMGLFLDLALRGCRNGRRIYLALIVAGVLTNLAAMSVQVAAKYYGWGGGGGGKSLAAWLPFASFTYPLCGALAGLLSAIVWFRWHSSSEHSNPAHPISGQQPADEVP